MVYALTNRLTLALLSMMSAAHQICNDVMYLFFSFKGELVEEELPEGGVGLHALRLALLDALVQRIPSLSSVGGVTTIPFFQVSFGHKANY